MTTNILAARFDAARGHVLAEIDRAAATPDHDPVEQLAAILANVLDKLDGDDLAGVARALAERIAA